jgi:hypothetical protein
LAASNLAGIVKIHVLMSNKSARVAKWAILINTIRGRSDMATELVKIKLKAGMDISPFWNSGKTRAEAGEEIFIHILNDTLKLGEL